MAVAPHTWLHALLDAECALAAIPAGWSVSLNDNADPLRTMLTYSAIADTVYSALRPSSSIARNKRAAVFQRRRPIAPRLPMAAWVVCVLAACASAAAAAAAAAALDGTTINDVNGSEPLAG